MKKMMLMVVAFLCLVLNGWSQTTRTVAGPITINGTTVTGAGSITGGVFAAGDDITVSSGTLTIASTTNTTVRHLTISSGATVVISASFLTTVSGTLTINNGTLTSVTPAGTTTPTITGGLLVNGIVTGTSASGSTGRIVLGNGATIDGTSTTVNLVGLAVQNLGTTATIKGTCTIPNIFGTAGTGSTTCVYTLGASSITSNITISTISAGIVGKTFSATSSSGTVNLTTGAGIACFTSGTANQVFNSVSITGTLGNSLSMPSGSTLNLSGGLTIASGATLTMNVGSTVNRTATAGALTVSGNYSASGCNVSYSNASAITTSTELPATVGTLTVNGAGGVALNANTAASSLALTAGVLTLNSNTTLNWTGSSFTIGAGSINASASGAVFQIGGGSAQTTPAVSNWLSSGSNLTISNSVGVTWSGSGSANITNTVGNLTFSSGYLIMNTASNSSFSSVINVTGTLSGSGQYSLNTGANASSKITMANNATIGSFVQSATSPLGINFNGTLNFTGTNTLTALLFGSTTPIINLGSSNTTFSGGISGSITIQGGTSASLGIAGSSPSTLSFSQTGSFNRLSALTISAANTLSTALNVNTLNLVAGTFTNTGTLTVDDQNVGGLVTVTSGKLSAAPVYGAVTGTNVIYNGGSITAGLEIAPSTGKIYNLTISSSGTITTPTLTYYNVAPAANIAAGATSIQTTNNTNLAVGQFVASTTGGIAAGSYITSITGSSNPYTVNLSAATTAAISATNALIDFGGVVVANNLTISSGTLALGTTGLYVGGNWTQATASSFSNSNNKIITFNGNVSQTITNSAGTGTISFGDYVVNSNTSGITLNANGATNIVVSRRLSLDPSTTFNDGGGTIILSGGFLTCNGNSPNIGSHSSTGVGQLILGGALSSTLPAISRINVGNLQINAGSTFAIQLSGVNTVSGNLNLNSGVLFYTGGTTTVSGNITGTGTVLQGNTPTTTSSATAVTSVTVASATGISAGQYVFGNGIPSGTQVATSYTPGSTTVPLTNTVTVGANPIFFNNNSISAPISLTGTNATISGATLASLTLNNASSLTGSPTILGRLTLSNGILTTSGFTINLANNATNGISGSSSAYVNGSITWTLPTNLASGSTYTFPVGTATNYLPCSLVNPTTGTGVVTAKVQAFNANSGGTLDATLFSKSTTEYWQLTTSGNFTNTQVSLSRPSAISPFNVIGASATLSGTYGSIAGNAGANGVTNSTATSTANFFVFAQAVITPTITVNIGTYTYSGNGQGPTTVLGNTGNGAVTWSYVGTGGTNYAASSTLPTEAGTYTATASVAANGLYGAAVSSATSFSIATATPSITVNVGNYTYTGNGQGPTTITGNTGNGTVTWSYVGTGGTSYAASPTLPISAGTYTATASVAANGNYGAATSTATSFTISTVAPNITVIVGSYTYNGNGQGPTTVSGNAGNGVVSWSYLGTGGTSYAASPTLPINAGSYTATASVTANGNYGATNSSATAFSIVASVPDAPSSIDAAGDNAKAQITFTAPSNNGGSVVIDYTITAIPSSGSNIIRTGITSSPYTFTGLANGVTYTFTIAARNIAGTGATITSNAVTPSSTTTWNGTSWSATAPDASQSGVIAANLNSNNVVGNFSNCAGLTINAGVTFTLNSNITINGAFVNNGTITGTGTITLAGSSAQVISGTGTVNNLTVNNSNGTTVSTGSNKLNITGVLTLKSGLLTTNGNVVLKSNSITSSGILAPVGTSGNSGTISGTVQVERYIPKGYRAWRDLAPQVYNAGSMFNNWQEGGNYTNGSGIFITGGVGNPSGTVNGMDGNGFDQTVNAVKSAYSYPNGIWTAISNTKTTILNPFTGYRVLVRGDRFFNLFTQPISTVGTTGMLLMVNATKVRAKGTLVTGDVVYNKNGVTNSVTGSTYTNAAYGLSSSTDSSFSLVANPYVCPIDWQHIYDNNGLSNLRPTYYYLDPTLGSTGAYVVYNAFSQTASNGSANTRYIQAGQAFFVQNNSSTNPSLTIKEANKAVASTKTAVFGTANKLSKLQFGLWKDAIDHVQQMDAATWLVNSAFSNGIGQEDALKLKNSSNNLLIVEGNQHWSIAGKQTVSANDSVVIGLGQLENGHYELRIDASNFDNQCVTPMLYDAVNKSYSTLSTEAPTTIGFEGSSNIGNRFKIVFKKAVKLTPNQSPLITIFPNPAKGAYTVQLPSVATTQRYSVTVYSVDGKAVSYEQSLIPTEANTLRLTTNGLTSGVYQLKVKGEDGAVWTVRLQVGD